MAGVLADLYKNAWWMLLIRGVLLVLFGILAVSWPGLALYTFIVFFGAFALVHGILSILGSIMNRRDNEDWWLVLLEGIVSIIIGVMTVVWPGLTGLVLAYFIAAWAVVMGILKIYGAIKLRKAIEGELLLIIAGIISVVFGIFIFARPLAGALAIAWIIGIYAIVFGLLSIVLSFRIKSWQKKAEAAG
jgi:uncharacterized membrane protein HdeD (DUF308 family)